MLLLIAGAPGAGKTTLARALSARLGWPLFEKDAFKEVLFDTVGFSSQAEKVRLNDAAMRLICLAAERTLACARPAMLESNFETRDLPELEAVLAHTGATCVTVRLEADADVLFARFAARQHAPTRHAGHIVNDQYPLPDGAKPSVPPLPKAAYIEGFAARGMFDFALGTLLRVDITDPSGVDVDALATRIDQLHTRA